MLAPVCTFLFPEFSTPPPYLKQVHGDAVKVQKLIQKGMVIKAWFELGSLVRLAELNHCSYDLGPYLTDFDAEGDSEYVNVGT